MAQAQGGETLTFTYDNPALHPPHYVLVVHGDGAGSYRVAADGDQPALDRPIALSAPLRDALFAYVRKSGSLKSNCDMNRHNLAFDGTKTLAYEGGGVSATCTYVHPKDAKLEALSEDLIATAYTLENGRKLELLLLHDRLGLDAELDALTQQHAARNALQMRNIAPVLQAIANDDGVLSRARERARSLLADPDPSP